MADFIKTPFAKTGDKTSITEIEGADGVVSFDKGFNQFYSLSLNRDGGGLGKPLQRQHFNYLFNRITEAIQELQKQGIRDWDISIADNGGYSYGDRCLVEIDYFTRQVVIPGNNSSSSNYRIKATIVSLKDFNTTSPYDAMALYKDWFLDDGVVPNSIVMSAVNYAQTPVGYLLANGTELTFANYPRIQEYLDGLAADNWKGLYYKASDNTFKVKDLQGKFFRATGGLAATLGEDQTAGVPNITGQFLQQGNQTALGIGAFSVKTEVPSQIPSADVAGNLTMMGLDASLVSSVYQNGLTEVRPANTSVQVYIKAF